MRQDNPERKGENINNQDDEKDILKTEELNESEKGEVEPTETFRYEEHPEHLEDFVPFYLKILAGSSFIYLTRYLHQLMNVSFLGQVYQNTSMMNAVGLVHLYSFAVHFCFGIVAVYAFDFVGSRAFGQRDFEKFGLIMHRTIIVVFSLFGFFYFLHYLTAAPLFRACGLDSKSVEYFDVYMKLFQLTYIFEYPHVIAVRYINLIHRSYISITVMLITLGAHFGFCWLFIVKMNLDVRGAAYASIATMFCNLLLETLYLIFFNPISGAIFFFKGESFSCVGLWEFLKVYFPLLPVSISGLWGQEIQMFIAFSIGIIDMAIHVILRSLANIFLGISYGNRTTITIVLGYYMGKRDVTNMYRVLYMAWISGVIITFFLMIFLLIFKEKIIGLFLNERFIIFKVTEIFPLFCVFLVLESINRAFYNWYRGIGYHWISWTAPVVSYLVVQLSVALILTKVLSMGVYGIWLSNLIAEFFSIIGLFILFFTIVDVRASCKRFIEEHDVKDKDYIEDRKEELDILRRKPSMKFPSSSRLQTSRDFRETKVV